MVSFSLQAATLLLCASAAASPVHQPRTAGIIPFARRQTFARRDAAFDIASARLEIERIKARHTRTSSTASPPAAVKRDVAALPAFDIQERRSSRRRNRRQGGSGVDALTNDQDQLYYGPLSIGTPAQVTTVDFDTGSSDLVIPTSDCMGCFGPLFSTGSSSTYTASSTPFSITYGDQSSAQGSLASDAVSVAGLAVQKQVFGAVTTESAEFGAGPNAGLLGMGFTPLSVSQASPFFINLAQQGSLASNLFSLSMTSQATSGSELCFGCIDSSKFTGSINYNPLDNTATQGIQYYWSILSSGVAYNGVTVTPGFGAVIDSGTTLVYVPTQVASELYTQIPGAVSAAQQVGQGFYGIPCNSTMPISFVFGGTGYTINSDNLVVGTLQGLGSNMCISGLAGLDSGDGLAIVGDVFLRSWYSVFDLGNMRVGFAQAV